MSSNKNVTLSMLSELVVALSNNRIASQSVISAANQPMYKAAASPLSVKLLQGQPSENPLEIAKLESALATISPHVPRGDGSMFDGERGAPSDSYWLGVIWAIAGLGWSGSKQIAKDWSKTSSRYTDEGFEKAWTDFNPNHAKPVGIGSVYKLAQCLGWQIPSTENLATGTTARKYKLLSALDVLSIPTTTWRVKHLFPEKGLSAIFGPSASGKSFIAFDLAACIAEGRTWFGHKTIAAPVVYVMLEGEAGIKKRVMAWEKGNGRTLSVDFKVVLQSVHVTDPSQIQSLAEVISKGSVVFIDTLNRAAPTADENSSKDMGAIIEGGNMLQHLIEGLVVLVHHTGKDTSQGMRGHSSLFAALDGAIEVKRSTSGRSWSVAKTKDGEDGKSTPFRLMVHDLGIDPDGEPITSCTVEAANASIFVKKPPTHAGPKNALKEITQVISSGAGTVIGIKGAPNGVSCLKMEDAIAAVAVASSLATVKSNKRNFTARQRIDSLTNSGHLGGCIDPNGDAWCWIEP
jgi:hypothetical protein